MREFGTPITLDEMEALGLKAIAALPQAFREQLGDVVFVELPAVGSKLSQGDEASVVESVKAASEVYMPVSGEVVEINGVIEDEPTTVNSDPAGEGWFFKIKLSDPSELDDMMDDDAYKSYIAGLD